jgi:phosphate transport system substrate-binding protein
MKLLYPKYIPLAVTMAAALLIPALRAQMEESADTKNALKAQVEHFRIVRERGEKAFYQPRFDLGALPHYVPQTLVTGWIKIHGNNYIADGLLGEYWQKAFARFQPGARISYYLPTSAGAVGARGYNEADIIF